MTKKDAIDDDLRDGGGSQGEKNEKESKSDQTINLLTTWTTVRQQFFSKDFKKYLN